MSTSASSRPAPERGLILHGVDFGGCDSAGSAKIRIAERVLAPKSAVTVRNRIDRHALRRAILETMNDGGEHLWRINAPFGLPIECFAEARPEGLAAGELTWQSIAQWMSGFASAREWRAAMREFTRREPKRACDRALHAPLAPMNLRMFKQTFVVITEILVPLVNEGVPIMPVSMPHGRTASATRVCESCPASVLASYRWPAKGYKGVGEPPRKLREDIIRLLRKEGIDIPSAFAVEAIHDVEGGLLDALIMLTPPISSELSHEAAVEGWIY